MKTFLATLVLCISPVFVHADDIELLPMTNDDIPPLFWDSVADRPYLIDPSSQLIQRYDGSELHTVFDWRGQHGMILQIRRLGDQILADVGTQAYSEPIILDASSGRWHRVLSTDVYLGGCGPSFWVSASRIGVVAYRERVTDAGPKTDATPIPESLLLVNTETQKITEISVPGGSHHIMASNPLTKTMIVQATSSGSSAVQPFAYYLVTDTGSLSLLPQLNDDILQGTFTISNSGKILLVSDTPWTLLSLSAEKWIPHHTSKQLLSVVCDYRDGTLYAYASDSLESRPVALYRLELR